MVLLHGFTDTWRAWTPLLPALEAHHDVLAPTLPGHHGGDPFPDGVEISMEALLDGVERHLDAAGFDKAHLVGSSLGGWMALELATRGRALSVVALCPGGGWDPGSKAEKAVAAYFKRSRAGLRAARSLLETIAKRPRLRRLALRDLIADPSRVDATSAMSMLEGAAECEVVDQVLSLSDGGALFGDLGPIDVPTRIAYGTADKLIRWPGHYERMKRILPDVEYVALEGLGHLPMWDDPARVAELILEVTNGGGGRPSRAAAAPLASA